jgi:hypothetical protein
MISSPDALRGVGHLRKHHANLLRSYSVSRCHGYDLTMT